VEAANLGAAARSLCPTCGADAFSEAGAAGVAAGEAGGLGIVGLIILSLPSRQNYQPGDTFDPTGMVIGIQYSNGVQSVVLSTDYTLSPDVSTALNADDTAITVTHTESSETINVPIAVRNTVLPVPPKLVAGQFVYDSESHAPILRYYNEATMTLGGDTSGTTAGSYTLTITPKTGFCWLSGSTDAMSFDWTIAKARPAAPTVAPDSLELTAIATPGTATVTRDGNGVVSAVSSDSEVCTVSVSDTTVTVTAVADGEAVVTVSVAAGTNYLAPEETAEIAVTVDLA